MIRQLRFITFASRLRRAFLYLGFCAAIGYAALSSAAIDAPLDHAVIQARFGQEVDRRLALPADEQKRYADLLDQTLKSNGISDRSPQYFVVVDRSPLVQAVLIYFLTGTGAWDFVGASPVSTGRPGSFEHFATPLGVFEHSLENPDFRAEGTVNEFGIRGYGLKGMRIFDFGWVQAERGWGDGGLSIMRLQMHATDPKLLEPLLGEVHSKGCIRIPASLNVFLDRYGLLDLHYLANPEKATVKWVLRADRKTTLSPGRFLVVIESPRDARPDWAPSPRRKLAVAKDTGSCALLQPAVF
jgi:hypothetical protein